MKLGMKILDMRSIGIMALKTYIFNSQSTFDTKLLITVSNSHIGIAQRWPTSRKRVVDGTSSKTRLEEVGVCDYRLCCFFNGKLCSASL